MKNIEPTVTISLSEYNQLLEDRSKLNNKTHVFYKEYHGYYGFSWDTVITNSKAIEKLAKINTEFAEQLLKLKAENKKLKEELADKSVISVIKSKFKRNAGPK